MLLRCVLLTTAVLAAVACSGDDADPRAAASSSTPTGGDAATETTDPSETIEVPETTTTAPPSDMPERLAPDADLYEVPDPIPVAPHGTLLRYQRVNSPLREGNVWRVMYTSRSLGGDRIVVTGVVMVPHGEAPDDGRVTWTIAHGTTGVADECAPSLGPDAGERLLFSTAARKGWIVAISDYEGLGTPGRHPYLVGPSEGRGVLDAALAAGELPNAEPSDQLLIGGYSQGGHGAAWANEISARWAPSFEVVGAFAGAPASELDLILDVAANSDVAHGFALMMIAGFAEAYPELDLADVLTREGMRTLDAVDEGCTGDVFEATDAADGRLIRSDAGDAADWERLLAASNPGHTVSESPVLIVHSAEDDVVPQGLSELMAERMCDSGQVVERRVLDEGGGHTEAAPQAFSDGMAWFDGLLEGQEPVSTCA